MDQVGHALDCCASVKDIRQWIDRFDELTRAVEAGKGNYRQVEDHVFELKVINYINRGWPEFGIKYQPKGMNREGKNCDLAVVGNEFQYLIELKAFHPKSEEKLIPREYVQEGNILIMDGRIYHDYQAVRGHLIDVTFDTERKFANYEGNCVRVLGLSVGYYLSVEDLRDFVAIYKYGWPRLDDPLGAMTMHNLRYPFEGSIAEFWAFPFCQIGFSFEDGDAVVVVEAMKAGDRPIRMA
jgi:hypothetical protein